MLSKSTYLAQFLHAKLPYGQSLLLMTRRLAMTADGETKRTRIGGVDAAVLDTTLMAETDNPFPGLTYRVQPETGCGRRRTSIRAFLFQQTKNE